MTMTTVMAEPLIPPEVPKEKIFYVTFGVMYRTEPHPMGMTPDGYVIIVADTYLDARYKAWELFGEYWAFLYDHLDTESGRFNPDSKYPRGVLAVYYA